jgi:LmbE family N-acetylglucosaminyl deacetylase
VRDVTLLIAHPDDEALFLWPFLDRVKRIVCASSDLNNPSRTFCRERSVCLREVCNLLDCEYAIEHNDSEFYRLPTRGGELKRVAETLAGHLRDAEIIATHNAWGEYGHLDHLLCHHIARTAQEETDCHVLATDIAQEINWLPVTPWWQGNQCGADLSERTPDHTFELDRPLFDRIKAIYDARGCWTWAWEPQATCAVYSL